MNQTGDTFDYLLDKVSESEMLNVPFRHIEITDFLSREHFEAIVGDHQIALEKASNTADLLDKLSTSGYEVAGSAAAATTVFPGLDRLSGTVCRLTRCESSILKELMDFFVSDRLKKLLVDKFGIRAEVHVGALIKKSLHGYEISPHPDVRGKALTWMLNINPSDESEGMDFHTHYMKLKDQWRFIGEFWRYNQDVERCWLPWDWCETVKQQTRNNSIVLFSPADDTIHAVKANYDHLQTQRTQVHGNLQYVDGTDLKQVGFAAFDLKKPAEAECTGSL